MSSQKTFELEEASIIGLQKGMQSGQRTARSIAELYIRRIEEIDKQGPAINAVLEINPDALAIADAMDNEREQGSVRGPLHGIPLMLKDNIDTADGMQTTAGSLALLGSVPKRDAFIVKGQHFEKGDPLFIVEVMKMFNKVYAPFSGTVDEILIDADSTIVKKGQVVFRVTPDEIVIEEPEDDMRAARIETTNSFLAFASH